MCGQSWICRSPEAVHRTTGALICGQPLVEFGQHEIGARLFHSFALTNTGDTDIRVLEVKPACGCTVVENAPKLIKPHETAALSVWVSFDDEVGDERKDILVRTDDPNVPELVLSTRAVVLPKVEAVPGVVEFPPDGTNLVSSVQLQARRPELIFQPLGARVIPSDSGAEVRIEPIVSGRPYRLVVEVDADFLARTPGARIEVSTNLLTQKSVRVPIRITSQ